MHPIKVLVAPKAFLLQGSRSRSRRSTAGGTQRTSPAQVCCWSTALRHPPHQPLTSSSAGAPSSSVARCSCAAT